MSAVSDPKYMHWSYYHPSDTKSIAFIYGYMIDIDKVTWKGHRCTIKQVIPWTDKAEHHVDTDITLPTVSFYMSRRLQTRLLLCALHMKLQGTLYPQPGYVCNEQWPKNPRCNWCIYKHRPEVSYMHVLAVEKKCSGCSSSISTLLLSLVWSSVKYRPNGIQLRWYDATCHYLVSCKNHEDHVLLPVASSLHLLPRNKKHRCDYLSSLQHIRVCFLPKMAPCRPALV